jgi:CRP-like cAMP-binding protein
MSLDRDIALLKRVPLFAGLNTEQLRLLAFSAVKLELSKGQVLFREGAKAMSGFVVATGRLELATGSEEKREVLATCEQGTLVGEAALFVETRRPATATAATISEVLEIERKLVARMLNEYPQVAVALRAILSERLVATVGELDKVQKSLRDIDRRATRR